MHKKTIVIGFLGSTLDNGFKEQRWQRWRPTVSLLMHNDLIIDELILLYDRTHHKLFKRITEDIRTLSPNTDVHGQVVSIKDPWNFAEMYGMLYDFVHTLTFDIEKRYLLHITTGTHVAQICWYLLIDAHYLPAKILQSSPTPNKDPKGEYRIIDLDLSCYDALTQRFNQERKAHWQLLKNNIATNNAKFNQLINHVEKVALNSHAPILLMGATGVGKSHLARQIFTLKKEKFHLKGRFVDVNCATLKGDSAMSALFGHQKGAFTGAISVRDGYLKSADGGVLFLDEIGELGLDEQAMLLKAIEDKYFFAVGNDKETRADFSLIAGTNKDLRIEVQKGNFREDLWARLNVWTFFLPSLTKRPEDIAPNIDFELQRFASDHKQKIRFHKQAQEHYLAFATSPQALWLGNFRDLNASVHRMATLCNKATIDKAVVIDEIERLKQLWQQDITNDDVLAILDSSVRLSLDDFDRFQLTGVLDVCLHASSMAEAGRQLFAYSRNRKQSNNDSDRVKKYLARFGLDWAKIQAFKNKIN